MNSFYTSLQKFVATAGIATFVLIMVSAPQISFADGELDCSITATPSTIAVGQPTTISWTSGGNRATISYIGNVGANGSYSVVPTTVRTFNMTAYDQWGHQGTCSVTLNSTGTVYNIPGYAQTNLPFCTLTSQPNNVPAGGTGVISWTSSNATHWDIAGIGGVGPTGSYTVRPQGISTYQMTVSNSLGSNTCSTTINGNATVASPTYNYNYTNNQPNVIQGYAPGYVPLSQVPYTGLDIGTFGMAMYLLALLAVAGAAGYLSLFYRGGLKNLVLETVGQIQGNGYTTFR